MASSIDLNTAFKNNFSLRPTPDGGLREATWTEKTILSFSKEDEKTVEDRLIQQLYANRSNENFVCKAEKYAQTHRYSRLSNLAFALRMSRIFPISHDHFVDESGNQKGHSLSIIRNNHLHRIIPQVDIQNQSTALFCKEETLYIRSETGDSFLTTTQNVNFLLEKLDPTHPHHDKLSTLLEHMRAKESGDEEAEWDDGLIDALQKELSTFYTYQRLEDIPHEASGAFQGVYYLANGIGKHSQRHFRELPFTHREDKERGMHTLSIVTRLPEYARERNFWRRLWLIVSNLFNTMGHGHSWLELTAPSPGGDLRQSVGYYFHISSKQRRLLSPDPQSFLPIRSDLLVRETIAVSEEQYQKAQKYMLEVQKMLDRKDKRIGDWPTTEGLTEQEQKEIAHIYNQAMKSTCLSFANALRRIIGGVQCDDRSNARRFILPQWLLKLSDEYLNPIWRVTNLGLIGPLSWLMRAEFPVYRGEEETTEEGAPSACSNTGLCRLVPQA